MNLTVDELLAYTAEERDRWERWFREHGEGALRFPLPGKPIDSLGLLLLHAMGAEWWFGEIIAGGPRTEWWKRPVETAPALFDFGREARGKLMGALERMPPEGWTRVLELQPAGAQMRVSVRKAVGNALVHEIRHFAQAAMLVRQNGIAPPGNHDLIFSAALE
jgi:uncharacterized damage-inducible protein DinB